MGITYKEYAHPISLVEPRTFLGLRSLASADKGASASRFCLRLDEITYKEYAHSHKAWRALHPQPFSALLGKSNMPGMMG